MLATPRWWWPEDRRYALKIHIDVDMNDCQDHGQCVFVAPETFWFGDDGRLEYQNIVETDDAGLSVLEEAADICPLQAILLRSK